jgi:hypothetical protein
MSEPKRHFSDIVRALQYYHCARMTLISLGR